MKILISFFFFFVLVCVTCASTHISLYKSLCMMTPKVLIMLSKAKVATLDHPSISMSYTFSLPLFCNHYLVFPIISESLPSFSAWCYMSESRLCFWTLLELNTAYFFFPSLFESMKFTLLSQSFQSGRRNQVSSKPTSSSLCLSHSQVTEGVKVVSTGFSEVKHRNHHLGCSKQ